MSGSIHLVFPELGSHGGVQRYGAHLARAVGLVARDLHWNVETYSLNDGRDAAGLRGFNRDKRALATALAAAALRDRPRAVMVGHTNLAPLGLIYRGLSYGTRVYVVAHGVEIESRVDGATRAGLFAATRVLAVSTWTRSLLTERLHLPRQKVDVLHFGMDESPVAHAAARGSGPLRLLTVSRLSSADRYKGIDVTIEALGALEDDHPPIEYVVVGDGDDRDRLERLAETCGVRARVHFRGSVSDGELQAAYAECDVFVLPSTHEGLGIVYLEAMAHGKAVIAAHAGGVADAVVHEMNGLLVESVDPPSVAAAIGRLAADPALRERLGRWGQEYTLPRFSFGRMVDHVGSLLAGREG